MRGVTGLVILGLVMWGGVTDGIEDQGFDRHDGVVLMDDHNYETVVAKTKFILVLLYGSDKESTQAQGEFAAVQATLKKDKVDVDFGSIDVDKNKEFDHKQPYHRSPTVRLYKNGKFFDYAGEMKSEHMVTWYYMAMNRPIKIEIASELEDLKKHTTAIVGVFPGKAPEAAYKTFYQASEHYVYDPELELPRFAVITSAKVARETGLVAGQIAIFKQFEDGTKVLFSGDTSRLDDVMKFLQAETVPVVFKHDLASYHHKLHHIDVIYHHMLFMSPTDRQYPVAFKNFKAVAAAYQAKDKRVIFVHVDTSAKDIVKYLGYFHVDTSKELPCNRMTKVDRFHSRFRPAATDFSYDALMRFTDDVVAGKQQRVIQSEQLPSDWNRYDVKVVVGSTYEKFLKDNIKKTIMMCYYFAGHKESEEALPIFNQAAKDMASNATVTYGRFDVSKNDGEVDVHLNYPSFRMFFIGGNWTLYNGPHTAKDLNLFVTTGGTSAPPEPENPDNLPEWDVTWKENEKDLIKEEEERVKQWEKEEKEYLAHAGKATEGQTIDQMQEHKEHEKEHFPEHKDHHNPEEHVDEAFKEEL